MRPLSTFQSMAWLSLMITALVMWYPQRHLFGVDLSNLRLQGLSFAISGIFWILARGGRLRSDPYFEFRSNIWEVDASTIRRNVLMTAFQLIAAAGIFEIGQTVLPHRVGRLGEFFGNALD